MNKLLWFRGTLTAGALLLLALLALGLASDVHAQVPPPLISTFPAGNAIAGTVVPGADLIRFPLNRPGLVCNDGTAPVIYLRQATTPASHNKWLIYLEGGGSCKGGDDCRDRWAGTGAQPNYGIQKMSTSVPAAVWNATHVAPPNGWTLQGAHYRVPPGIVGTGILSSNPANPFADWNVVFAYYCSSDSWSGQAANQVLTTTLGVDYRLHFRGAAIFDAIIDQLRSGATVYQHDGQECAMPDLDDAKTVLLAGSSAGGNGVKHNLDRLHGRLQAANPGVDVRGVIDAAGTPTRELLPWTGAAPANSYANYMQAEWNIYTTVWNHRGDASCLALNPVEPWRCADNTHVLRHHITTPFFHRMDLQDENGIDSFLMHYSAATYEYEFAVHTSSQLNEIAALLGVLAPRYPAEAAMMAGDPRWLPPGVYGPRCTNHVGLLGGRTFAQQQVPDALGALTSYVDALWDWVNITPGAGVPSPRLVAAAGVGAQGLTYCP